MLFSDSARVRFRLPRRLSGGVPLLLLFSAGILLSALAAFWVRETENETARQEFARRALVRHQFLANNFGTYESVLFALRLMVENNVELEPREFERAASSIRERAPGILALQWAPVMDCAVLPDFVQRVRELHAPAFGLRELNAGGQMVPFSLEPPRDQHAIITYTYPAAGNELTVGYDILTAPTAPDLRRALQSRQSTLTRSLTLVQGDHGVVLTAYADREETPAGPPLAGPGFVQVVLRLTPMLNQLWNIGAQNHTDFALYDVTEPEPAPLYSKLARADEPLEPIPSYDAFITPDTVTHDLRLGGRSWRACYRPNAEWLAETRGGDALAVLIGGVLLTVFSIAFLDQIRRRAHAVEREVRLRTSELNDSRALLDSVIEHSSSAIWVKDADLRYFLVNEEFCKTYARDRTRIIGKTDHDFYDETAVAEMERIDREILRNGRTLRYEGTYNVLGRPLTYLVGKFPLRHADGSIYAVGGIATDITTLRQVQTEKNIMERRLLEAQKLESLGVLAGGIAHDFNNLLTGILGHASLLAATLPASSGAHASITQIESASRRAAELCRHMLAYSGRGRYVLETVELGALVRDILPLIQPSLGKTARVQTDFGTDLPWVTADITQLRQAIMNLVVNASEAIGDKPGDITLRTRLVHADADFFASCVHSPALPPGDYVSLEVSDTGCGLAEDIVARIFDPFFTTKFAGRGLGLAAVLGIVRGHQGAIRVTTRPGQGAAFSLFFPASKGKKTAPSAPLRDLGERKRKHLLLVDDEATVRQISAQLLMAIGFETTTAANGEEALRAFRSSPAAFDAALIDLTMPDMTGGEVMTALRELRADVPVILMSGYNEKDAAELLSSPRTTFLAKPFTLEILRAKIAGLLDT
jgi:two-component system cell cycle sensor histidine kinase/response regulator CckA